MQAAAKATLFKPADLQMGVTRPLCLSVSPKPTTAMAPQTADSIRVTCRRCWSLRDGTISVTVRKRDARKPAPRHGTRDDSQCGAPDR